MGINRGKKFEEAIKRALLKDPEVSLDRFQDPAAGYAGIRNISDFVAYKYPYEFYFECKAFSGNTLNFGSAITKDQWIGLNEKSRIPGVFAGIIVWFVDHDFTAFVPIQELNRLRDGGSKSLNVSHLKNEEVIHFPLSAKKKRIFFEYRTEDLLRSLMDSKETGGYPSHEK